MSLAGFMFSKMAGKSDAKRDANLQIPSDVEAVYNINYRNNQDVYNNMDIYFPKQTVQALPTVVSIHGGGYVYGTKEIYKHYGMFIAQQGFTFVNFNYHLAPKAKFPSQFEEINDVMKFLVEHAREYPIDLQNIFLVGDSAGAQMTSQYAAILTNKAYAKKFSFSVAKGFCVKALGLNCGMYDFEENSGLMKGLRQDYLGKRPEKRLGAAYKEMLDVLSHITENYPPAYILTAEYDFLKEKAEPMYNFLKSKGIEAQWNCYGEPGQEYMSHVCHVNMNLEEAKKMNLDELDFFRKHIV